MITDLRKRQQILRKIYNIPSEKLNKLDAFLSELENRTVKKNSSLRFAGAWKTIDEDIFKELTDELIHKRNKSKIKYISS